MRIPSCFLALAFPLFLGAQTPEAVPEVPKVEPAPVTAPSPETASPIAATPKTEPVADAGILLCYRQKRFAGAILNTSVFVDGVEIADMDNGTYLKVKVAPGEHTIFADEKKDALVLPIEPGKTYYFRMTLRAGVFKGHGKLEPVDEVTGQKEFSEWKAKLIYAKDIRKQEMVLLD